MIISKANYCFQQKNIWYFRKRIPQSLNKKSPTFRVSLISLLGKKTYYTLLLNCSLFNVVSYINNKIELLFLQVESLSMNELSEYTRNLIAKYEIKALNLENKYVNATAEHREIENLRYEALTFYDVDGNRYKGHTQKALQKELDEINYVCDEDEEELYIKKMNDILRRQNIIKDFEIKEIKKEEISLFAENLIKKEREVISQDLANSRRMNKDKSETKFKTREDLYEALENSGYGQVKEIIKAGDKFNQNKDDWDFIKDSFLKKIEMKNSSNTLRASEFSITLFEQILKGDLDFGIPPRNLLQISLNDILEIKELLLDLPKIKQKQFENWREKGVLYTIALAKTMESYEKNTMSSINSYVKCFVRFLKHIKKFHNEKYKNLNVEIFDELKIEVRELSEEDLKDNEKKQKIHLEAYILNAYFKDKYNPLFENGKGQSARNFTRHTTTSPHIFWAPILAMFTGARPQELAQLLISDINKISTEEETIYYFKIQVTTRGQSVKTKNAIREIPISKHLIDLGFLNYIQERINKKAKFIFDLLEDGDGKKSEFQESFNTYIKSYVKSNFAEEYTNAKLPSIYDLRSFFISKYLKSDIVDLRKFIDLKKMIGHTTKGLEKDLTLEVYDKERLNMKRVYENINNTNFEIGEAYEILKEKMINKYKEIQTELKI